MQSTCIDPFNMRSFIRKIWFLWEYKANLHSWTKASWWKWLAQVVWCFRKFPQYGDRQTRNGFEQKWIKIQEAELTKKCNPSNILDYQSAAQQREENLKSTVQVLQFYHGSNYHWRSSRCFFHISLLPKFFMCCQIFVVTVLCCLNCLHVVLLYKC